MAESVGITKKEIESMLRASKRAEAYNTRNGNGHNNHHPKIVQKREFTFLAQSRTTKDKIREFVRPFVKDWKVLTISNESAIEVWLAHY